MTDSPTSGAGPDLQRAIVAFQRRAFAALLARETPRVADVAEAASRDTLGVAHAVTWLEDHGELERSRLVVTRSAPPCRSVRWYPASTRSSTRPTRE